MSTMTFSAESLENCLRPGLVADKAAKVVKSSESTINEVCRLHRFCLEEVSYEKRENLRPAHKILESRAGDCTDQTVLLSSFLLSRGISSRIAHIQDHMFPEALIPAEPGDQIDRRIGRLYNLQKQTKVKALGEPNTQDNIQSSGYWYPVDSEMSKYLGDLQTLAEEDLIIQKNGGWQFHDVKMCKAYRPEDFEHQT